MKEERDFSDFIDTGCRYERFRDNHCQEGYPQQTEQIREFRLPEDEAEHDADGCYVDAYAYQYVNYNDLDEVKIFDSPQCVEDLARDFDVYNDEWGPWREM